MTRVLTVESTRTVARTEHGGRATIASSIGFALDFYDLYVVVFVAPVIAELFFPSRIGSLSLAGAFGALAATLLMRPVGAALMGSLADRRGRSHAMIVSLVGVGTVTVLMALVPTHRQIGLLAPVLLLSLRLVQGLFVGGVFASTLTMAIETVRPSRRGLVSGLVGGGGTAAGTVLAALSLFVATRLFPGPAFAHWGWRAMFLLGGLPALLSLLAARYVEDPPLWERTGKHHRPVREVLARPYRGTLGLNVPIVFGIGTHFLLTVGFLPTYLQVVNHLSRATVSALLVLVNLAALGCAPVTGQLSERFGRRRVLLAMTGVNTVLLPGLYWLLAQVPAHRTFWAVVVITVIVSCLTIGAFGPLPIFLNERFPTAVRASGIALSVNAGFAVAGLVPTAVNAWSGSVARLPAFAVGALLLAGVVTVTCLAAAGEPRRGLDD